MRLRAVPTIINVVIFCVATSVNAGICAPAPVEKNNPHAYVSAFVQALSVAKEAVDRSEPPASDEPLAVARAFMTSMKLMQCDYDCAASHLRGYASSDRETIKVSAEAGTVVFSSLRDVMGKELEWYRDMLDGKVDLSKTGSLADHMSETAIVIDDLWKTLPMAAIASTYSLVQFGPNGAATGSFAITESQRNQLRSALVDAFGSDIKAGLQKGQLPIVASAGANVLCRDSSNRVKIFLR
jgi:hypothetical protein